MATIELERTLVKSAPELWDEIAREAGLSRWLGEVRVSRAEPPRRLEWNAGDASGVIELEASGWGTRVRALAEPSTPVAWRSRLQGRHALERSLQRLLDDLGAKSLTSG
jgi:hypothetical protein